MPRLKITERVGREIVRHIRDGNSRSAAAKLAGLEQSTLHKHLRTEEGTGLRRRVEKAEAEFRNDQLAQLKKSPDWRARKLLLDLQAEDLPEEPKGDDGSQYGGLVMVEDPTGKGGEVAVPLGTYLALTDMGFRANVLNRLSELAGSPGLPEGAVERQIAEDQEMRAKRGF
jgi:hypothetical protein